MKQSEIVREQFNKQAQLFSDWAVTKNIEYLRAISEFIKPSAKDSLLDVACGTGEFALYISSMLKSVIGIDISDNMIELALQQKNRMNIKNAEFKIAEVSQIPYSANLFDIVFSKSAFHHFEDASEVFNELARCCKSNGKIVVCDILAFENIEADSFFEEFEKAVDISHHKTLSKQDFSKLFEANSITIEKQLEVEIEHTISEYLSHAIQNEENDNKIDLLISQAKANKSIGSFWTSGNNREDTKFRKKGSIANGKKMKGNKSSNNSKS